MQNPTRDTSGHWWHWPNRHKLPLLSIIVCILLAYGSTVTHDFVSDDIATLVNNPKLGSIPFLFLNKLQIARYAVFFIIYHVFGPSPVGYRATDILMHMIFTICGYVLLCRIASKRVAWISALLFAVHPIESEAISWISGGVYIQYGMFFLLGIVCYAYSDRHPRLYPAAIAMTILSVFTSEKAFGLIPIIFLYEWIFGNPKSNWKKLLPFAGIMCTVMAGYFGFANLLSRRTTEVLSQGYLSQGKFYDFKIQLPLALYTYAKLLVWPQQLSFYHFNFDFSRMAVIKYYIVTIMIFSGTIIAFFRNKHLFFWIAFFFIGLAPMLTPLKIAWIVADRYAYIGSFGIMACFGYGIDRLWKIKKVKPFTAILFALLIFSLMTRTIIRTIDWTNADTLWIATAKTDPDNPEIHNNLGDMYGRHNQPEKAIAEFTIATKLNPNFADAYHNIGNTYVTLKKYDEAIPFFRKALILNPNLWQSYQMLAGVSFEKKEYRQALEYLNAAGKVSPENPLILTNIGTVYLALGDKLSAKTAFTKALMLNPGNTPAKQGLDQSR